MIKTLKSGNRDSIRKIAKSFLNLDESQIYFTSMNSMLDKNVVIIKSILNIILNLYKIIGSRVLHVVGFYYRVFSFLVTYILQW